MANPNITIEELQQKLTEMKVDFEPDASQMELLDLLKEALEKTPLSSGSTPPPSTSGAQLAAAPATADALPGNDNVVVKKEFLDNLVDRLAKLEKNNMTPEQLAEERAKPRVYTVKVRFLNDKMVIGYGLTKERFVADRNAKRMFIEVITEDSAKTEVDWLEFKELGVVQIAEVVEKKVENKKTTQGFVFKTEYDYDNYRGRLTDIQVPLIVETPEISFTLKLPSGKIVTLPAKAIN